MGLPLRDPIRALARNSPRQPRVQLLRQHHLSRGHKLLCHHHLLGLQRYVIRPHK